MTFVLFSVVDAVVNEMPSFEENTQALVDGLFAQDQQKRLTSIRRIKNAIIGNQTKKSSFMLLGVIPRLVTLIEEEQSGTDLVSEAVITLGSFAHGTPENVQAVLTAKALPLLIRGVCHGDNAIVSASIRTLRTLYQSGRAPSSAVFQEETVARQLVQLVSSSSPLIGQCAATVLAKACQSQEHQNVLCAHGIVDTLSSTLQSSVPKLIHASLQCLTSVVHENKMSADQVTEATCNGQPLVSVVTKVLSGNHGNDTKLAAAQCLTYLSRAGAISSSSSTVTLKVLPALVRLCRRNFDSQTRADAARALAYLTHESVELQELAANSDRLIASLVEYLQERPDENDDLVQEKHFTMFDNLRESVYLALASLASTREEIRMKVVSERPLMKCLSDALTGDNVSVKVAATRCLHSLSRSTKLLRTSIVDVEVWRPVLEMLSLRDEECLQVASGVACNLLLAFSPSREKLVEGGVVETLSNLVSHANATIQLNALWGLMSVAYDSGGDVKSRIKQSLGLETLFEYLTPSTDQKLLMKGLGLMVNLIQNAEDADSLMSECGGVLLNSMVALLQHNTTNQISEQVMCVLMNISNASGKSRDTLINCDELMRAIAEILKSSDCVSLLMATCSVVKHLADSSVQEHIHRQNCLEDYGVKVAVQKLEKIDNSRLQDIVKDILDHFSSLSV